MNGNSAGDGNRPVWRSYIDRIEDGLNHRDFSKITENLYLGGAPGPNQAGYLRSLGIRNILSVAKECHDEWITYTHNEFNLVYVGMRDHEPLPPVLARLAITTLRDFLKRGKGKTLVHCGVGISRSPTIISLYWLAKGEVNSYEEGIQKLQALRSVVRPNRIVDHNLLQMVGSLRKRWAKNESSTVGTN